jgi:voltage-gated potassium channel
MYEKVKKKVHRILEPSDSAPLAGQIFTIFIMALILLNVIAVILETVESYYNLHPRFFYAFNFFTVMVFSIEYILRVWSCTEDKRYKNPITGRIKFMLSPLALIDLIAILPFYLPLVTHVDLRVLRILRLFRIFKMTRYSSQFKVFTDVLKEKKDELVISAVLILILLVLSASLMYFVEQPHQPEVFSSIPATMWWAVVTLSTVGYGNVLPVTPFGKVLAGVVAVLGISLFALPAGIIASGFIEQVQRKRRKGDYCPHCGKPIH